ncbi:uncharacterized protein [Argopecten irradians]|uniref:uncharacterized protein n=1 Tax=Argopecten irradians TaxID=31199 RepID=UPI0037195035
MGCKFTKIREQRSRDDDGRLSEVISQSSSFTESKKDLEVHTAPVTRNIVEKCLQSMHGASTEEEELSSLHMFPSSNDGDSDADSMTDESEMDISLYQEEQNPDNRNCTPFNDVSSLSAMSRYSSSISSKLSSFFRKGNRSRQNSKVGGMIIGKGDGNKYDLSSVGLSSSSPTGTKNTINDSISCDGIQDLDIEDDGRPSSSSASEESVLPPQISCRVVARPTAARGTRKRFVEPVPDKEEIAQQIVEFEAEVEQLIGEHAIPTRDYRNRQLRPRGARGLRLPSFSLQYQDPVSSNGTASECGKRYSKHFADTVTRPQLTVRGLTTANDCLTSWMVSQQRKDSERL